MSTDVDMCNSTLLALGQDKSAIAKVGEDTKFGRIFARAYAPALDIVLSERVWPFATTAAVLTKPDEDPFPGWGFRYTYPSDCTTLLAVCTSSGVRAGLSALRCCWDLASASACQFAGKTPFDVVYGDQSTCIVTDLDDAYAIYGVRVIDTGRFSELFCDAVSAKLAQRVAVAVAGELGMKMGPNLTGAYELALAKASAHALSQASEDPVVSPGLLARGGY